MNKQQLRDIVKQDNARRAARVAAEDALLSPVYSPCPEGVDPYLWDRHITGVPSQGNRDYKASDNCWKRGMRGKTTGVAPGTELTATEATVLVTFNGVTTIKPVSEFRGKRVTHGVRVKREAIMPEVAKLPSIRQGESY